MRTSLLIFPWLLYSSICHGYRFLALIPYSSHSHFVMIEQLLKGLVRKGHQVDVISNYPLKEPYPNYNDILTLAVMKSGVKNNVTYEQIEILASSSPAFIIAEMFGNNVCEILSYSKIQEIIRNPPKDPPYDAVIMQVCK